MNERLIFSLYFIGLAILAMVIGILIAVFFTEVVARILGGLVAVIGLVSLVTGVSIALGRV